MSAATESFEVGDAVVHPHHGAGRVVSRRRRRVLGDVRDYLEIVLPRNLRIMVPCDAANAVGLRAVVGPAGLRRIVEVLEDEPEVVSESWQARQRRLRGRLKPGDVLGLAAVVRDLAARDAQSGLPTSERDLYERCRRQLASELCYALGVDGATAAQYIDEHVTCA
jgi:CarD family transcriptional regulator